MNQNTKKNQQIAMTVGTGAQMLAGITSCFIIYTLVVSNMPDYLPYWLQIGLTALMTLGVVAIIEIFPRTLLPQTLDTMFSQKNGYGWALSIFTLLLCLGLQMVSVATSYNSKDLIAKTIVKRPPVKDVAAIALSKDAQKTDRIQKLDKEIEGLKETQNKRLKAAKRESNNILAGAIASRGPKMKQLFQSGNGWASEQLKGVIKRAKSKGNSIIDRESKRIELAIHERNNLESNLKTENDNLTNLVITENNKMISVYNSDVSKYEGFAIWIGIGGTIVFLLMQLYLALLRKVSGEVLITVNDSPPLLHSVFGIGERVMNMASNGLYYLAENEEVLTGKKKPHVNQYPTPVIFPALPPVNNKPPSVGATVEDIERMLTELVDKKMPTVNGAAVNGINGKDHPEINGRDQNVNDKNNDETNEHGSRAMDFIVKPPSVKKVVSVGYEITCQHCGNKANKLRATAKYCSDSCRVGAHNKKAKRKINVKKI